MDNDTTFGISIEATNFKLKQKRFVLTYKGFLNKEKLVEWFSTTFYDLKLFGVAHETGDTGYEHTHFLINTVKQPNITNSRKFDYEGIHPNVKKLITEKHWTNWYGYLYKQDTNPYTNIKIDDMDKQVKTENLIKAIEKHKTWGAVLRDKEIASEIRWCKAWAEDIFNSKPKALPKCDITMRDLMPWQKDLYKKLKGKPKDREIIWVWSPKPEQGKSTYKKYLENKFNVLTIDYVKNIDSVGFLYNYEDIIIIDLDWAKSKKLEKNLSDFYSTDEYSCNQNFNDTLLSVLETLSNHGSYTSYKYKGKHCVFDCHICIMSNCDPVNAKKHLPKRLFTVEATLNK